MASVAPPHVVIDDSDDETESTHPITSQVILDSDDESGSTHPIASPVILDSDDETELTNRIASPFILDSDDETELTNRIASPVILDSDDETELTHPIASLFINRLRRRQQGNATIKSLVGGCIDVPRPISATIPLSMISSRKRTIDNISGESSKGIEHSKKPLYEPVVIAPDNIYDDDISGESSKGIEHSKKPLDELVVFALDKKDDDDDDGDFELPDNIMELDEDTAARNGSMSKYVQKVLLSSSKHLKSGQNNTGMAARVQEPETFETKNWVLNTDTNILTCENATDRMFQKDIKSCPTYQEKFKQNTCKTDPGLSEAFETKFWTVNTSTNSDDKSDVKPLVAKQKLEHFDKNWIKFEADGHYQWVAFSKVEKTEAKEEDTDENKNNIPLITDTISLAPSHRDSVQRPSNGATFPFEPNDGDTLLSTSKSDSLLSPIVTPAKAKIGTHSQTVAFGTQRLGIGSITSSVSRNVSVPATQGSNVSASASDDGDTPISRCTSDPPLSPILTPATAKIGAHSQTVAFGTNRLGNENIASSVPHNVSVPATQRSNVSASSPSVSQTPGTTSLFTPHPKSADASTQAGSMEATLPATSQPRRGPEVTLRRALGTKVVLKGKNDKIFCGVCSTHFSKLVDFMEHFKKSLCAFPLICHVCHKSFHKPFVFIDHFWCSDRASGHGCRLDCGCGQVFTHYFQLYIHTCRDGCKQSHPLIRANEWSIDKLHLGTPVLRPRFFTWKHIERERLAVIINKKVDTRKSCKATAWTITVKKMDKSTMMRMK